MPILRRRAAAIMAGAILSGCAVGPNFHRPAAPQTDRYTAQPLAAPESPADSALQSFVPGQNPQAEWWGGLQLANPSQARTLLPPCLRVKMSSHRRPPSSAVSALVLSLTSPLLCAYLRVSASPRQNHSLRFPIPFPHGRIRGMELCVLYVSDRKAPSWAGAC